MIYEERRVSVEDLFSDGVKKADYAVIPSYKTPAAKVKFNGKEVETKELETPESKLYCIKHYKENNVDETMLLFDNCLFNMPIAPFKEGKEICFKNSFLKKYLKTVFLPAFLDAVKLKPDFKIKCNILSKAEVFGESEENDAGQLDWFKEPKHKIAMYKDYSDWWWLSDCEYKDEDNPSSAYFAYVSYNGGAYYGNASYTGNSVRPRFVIERKA